MDYLTWGEMLLLITLVMSIFLCLSKSFLDRDYYAIWSPMTCISITYIYYCVIGPLIELTHGSVVILRGIDHRPYFFDAWLGALLSYLGVWLGFAVCNVKIRTAASFTADNKLLLKNARMVFFIAVGLLILLFGAGSMVKLRFWEYSADAGVGGYSGSFSGYAMQAIVFFISASLLAFIPFLRKQGAAWFVAIFVVTFSLFVNFGFRWRLVVLFYALVSVFHLEKRVKLNLKLGISLLLALLLLVGGMAIARSYGRGMRMERLEGVKAGELIDNAMTEAACFLASGFIINKYQDTFDHSGFDFLVNAISAPVPRALWPDKPDGSYIGGPIMSLYGGNRGTGQAALNYAEYFMAFGWYGVIIFPFLMGLFLKRCWLWYIANKSNDYAIIMISLINGMMYMWVSRGYFSLFLTLFILVCLPVWILHRRDGKKKRLAAEEEAF